MDVATLSALREASADAVEAHFRPLGSRRRLHKGAVPHIERPLSTPADEHAVATEQPPDLGQCCRVDGIDD